MVRDLRRRRNPDRKQNNHIIACNWTDAAFRLPLPLLAGRQDNGSMKAENAADNGRNGRRKALAPATPATFPLSPRNPAAETLVADSAFYINIPSRQRFSAASVYPRPFIRAWAKLIDLNLYMLTIGLALSSCATVLPLPMANATAATTAATETLAVAPSSVRFLVAPWLTSLLGIMAALFAALMLDALILHKTGTSPGKWLMRIHIVTPPQRRLSTAVKRSLWCFSHGLCCGIMPLLFFSMCHQITCIAQGQTACWDRKTGYTVHYGEPTLWSYAFIIIFVVLGTLLLLLHPQ